MSIVFSLHWNELPEDLHDNRKDIKCHASPWLWWDGFSMLKEMWKMDQMWAFFAAHSVQLLNEKHRILFCFVVTCVAVPQRSLSWLLIPSSRFKQLRWSEAIDCSITKQLLEQDQLLWVWYWIDRRSKKLMRINKIVFLCWNVRSHMHGVESLISCRYRSMFPYHFEVGASRRNLSRMDLCFGDNLCPCCWLQTGSNSTRHMRIMNIQNWLWWQKWLPKMNKKKKSPDRWTSKPNLGR